jgi:hypothetical protein
LHADTGVFKPAGQITQAKFYFVFAQLDDLAGGPGPLGAFQKFSQDPVSLAGFTIPGAAIEGHDMHSSAFLLWTEIRDFPVSLNSQVIR